MVKFTDTGFVVQFETAQPGNDYTGAFREMITLMQSVDPDMRGDDNYHHLFELMKNMVPTARQAQFMLEDEDDGSSGGV